MSSTIIIVKILYDKHELETLAGRITLGVLVVGIGFVAVLTGAMAERFLASDIEEVAETADQIEALFLAYGHCQGPVTPLWSQ